MHCVPSITMESNTSLWSRNFLITSYFWLASLKFSPGCCGLYYVPWNVWQIYRPCTTLVMQALLQFNDFSWKRVKPIIIFKNHEIVGICNCNFIKVLAAVVKFLISLCCSYIQIFPLYWKTKLGIHPCTTYVYCNCSMQSSEFTNWGC